MIFTFNIFHNMLQPFIILERLVSVYTMIVSGTKEVNHGTKQPSTETCDCDS